MLAKAMTCCSVPNWPHSHLVENVFKNSFFMARYFNIGVLNHSGCLSAMMKFTDLVLWRRALVSLDLFNVLHWSGVDDQKSKVYECSIFLQLPRNFSRSLLYASTADWQPPWTGPSSASLSTPGHCCAISAPWLLQTASAASPRHPWAITGW